MKIDFKELVRMVEEVSSKDYQKSDRIKTHASRRMSTKGKANKIGKPYSQDPPTARAKSAPPGFGFTMEDLYRLIDEALEEHEDQIVTEANLSFGQLAKSPARLQAFIKKLESGEPFELNAGGEIVLKKDPAVIASLKQMLDSGEISTAKARELGVNFQTEDGTRISLGALKKTAEFGGRGTDFYVKKEIAARGQLQDVIAKAKAAAKTEAIIIRVLNEQGEEVAKYDDVVDVEDTQKMGGVDPKSDFQLVRKDGKPPVYISHKDGTSAKHFGQWSGLTPKAGTAIAEHPEVLKFIEDIKSTKLVDDGSGNMVYPAGKSFARPIQDRRLMMMSIFGQDYTPEGPGGPNNCDLVAQGLFELKTDDVEKTPDDAEVEVVYTLTATHLIARTDLDFTFGQDYVPTLMTRFASARKNFGIKGMRATIYPKSGRKHEMLDAAPDSQNNN